MNKHRLLLLPYLGDHLHLPTNSGGNLDILGGGQTNMEAKTYAKAYTTTNESSLYFCKPEIIGGGGECLSHPLMSATAAYRCLRTTK